jgi:hypothetical protein
LTVSGKLNQTIYGGIAMKILLTILFVGLSVFSFAEDKYINTTLGFEMSPPQVGEISSVVYQNSVFYLPAKGGFAANVNVQIQQYTDTIEDYKKVSEEEFGKMSLKTIKSAIENGVFVTEYSGKMQGYDLHFYAKAFKTKDKIYLITAASLETSWETEGPLLTHSINSFKLSK